MKHQLPSTILEITKKHFLVKVFAKKLHFLVKKNK